MFFHRLTSFIISIFLIFTLLATLLPNLVFANIVYFTDEEQDFINKNPIVVVGGEADWPPVSFLHNGQYTGITNDYLKLIEEHTGLHFQVLSGFTRKELLSMFEGNRIDILPALQWSSDAEHSMLLTSPYLTLRHYTYTRQAETDIQNINDLLGKSIAIPAGYSYLENIKNDYPHIEVVLVGTLSEAIDAVITQKADAMIGSTALISHFLHENNIHGMKAAFPVGFSINEIHMAVQKDNPILHSIIEKTLTNLTKEEQQHFVQRWINTPDKNKDSKLINSDSIFTEAEQLYLLEKKALLTCIDPSWQPYEALDEGRHVGISSEYMAYFSEQIGIPINVVPTQSWEESLAFARARKCDIISLASNRPERRKYLNFTQPYIEAPLALATRNDQLFFSDFTELVDERVGMVRGYSPGKVISERYPNIQLVEYDNINQGLESVQSGEILGFMDSVPTLSYHIQNSYPGSLKISGKFDYDWHVGIAARNDEPLLVHILDKVIKNTPDSVHNQIKNSWLSVRYEGALDYRLIWQISIGFTLVLVIILLRYRQLSAHRKEVALKNSELAKINGELLAQKEAAQRMANHDLLTGLPNRSHLMVRLDKAMLKADRTGDKVALLFIDLDRFKYVNDSLGHHVGDELLCVVSNSLSQRIRGTDTLARIGGDEFLVVMEDFDDEKSPAILAQDIIDSMQMPFRVRNHEFQIGASIGISIYSDQNEDINTLIKHADIAMYQAKDAGRNCFRYYSHALSEDVEKRLSIENALREALRKEQFVLVYQPIVNLRESRVTHAEALLRWHHPELGVITPDIFIPLIEENGMIHEVGLWVLREACRQLREWKRIGLGLQNISVNVSSIQFQQTSLIEKFAEVLKDEKVSAYSINIEITESHLMDQTERNITFLNGLKHAGHSISVDDFGVGYSSMSYMKRLPLDVIKIDRSFISDIPEDKNDIQITQAIVALAKNLGYSTVAEGVEKVQQMYFLQQIGCHYAQGYFFSKPLGPQAFEKRVNDLNDSLPRMADFDPTL